MVVKLLITLVACITIVSRTQGQANQFTVKGGFALANVKDTKVGGKGFRVNALYEYDQGDGRWLHGFSAGYVKLSAVNDQTNYKITSLPFYYAPKYLFGGTHLKGFVRGILGWQLSAIDQEGPTESISNKDTGFMGGGGVGAQYWFNQKIFLDAEYELLYMNNSFYKDGMLHALSLGFGFRF